MLWLALIKFDYFGNGILWLPTSGLYQQSSNLKNSMLDFMYLMILMLSLGESDWEAVACELSDPVDYHDGLLSNIIIK